MNAQFDTPLAFGIDAATGRPLEAPVNGLDPASMRQQEALMRAKSGDRDGLKSYGLSFDVDPDQLAEAGWGLIVAADVDPAGYVDALNELLTWRQAEAGNRYRVFSGPDGYRAGERAITWLERNGASLNQIDPEHGVPFYLAIVGPPSEIPFEFQYSLDIVAGVGRLDFRTLDQLRAYAHSVVTFERDRSRTTRRRVDLFATWHDFDRATQLFTEQVAQPFVAGTASRPPLGNKYGFAVRGYLREQSTKASLATILQGRDGPPSILFTGSHGMAFPYGDARQAQHQGALVCGDWPGYGTISDAHWFSADDVPTDADVHGMVHFFFACYGLGTPEYDNFQFKPPVPRIAENASTARLPQTLMSLPNGGVLASLGHIDRAWASSFRSSRGVAQSQGFRDVLGRLMVGQRVGYATDQFNSQWGVIGTELINKLDDREHGKQVPDAELLALRIARDDCRNYVVLGDPAVKLRPEQAPRG